MPRLTQCVLCLLLLLAPLARPARAASTAHAPHLTVELIPRVPVTVNGQPAGLAVSNPKQLQLGLYFKLDPGWHVYWSNPGDSGEPPAVAWNLPPGFHAGSLLFPAPKRLPLGPLMDYGYEGEVLFPVNVETPRDLSTYLQPSAPKSTIAADVRWLVCREACIPGKAHLTLDLPLSPASDAEFYTRNALFQAALARVPKPLPPGGRALFASNGQGFSLALTAGHPVESAQFYPFDSGVVQNAAPQPAQALKDGIRLDLAKSEDLHASPAALDGVVVLGDGAAYVVHATPGTLPSAAVASKGGSGSKVLEASGLAFLGGILLNLMPCVFPVLFIKALALVQSSGEERRHMRAQGLVYTLGILASFWAVVALLLTLRAEGQHLGWGFQFQSPSFVAIMAMLLFFLGLSLAGMFDIGLSLTGKGSSLAAQKGYAGSFFTGVLAMVVATPCTAPFMGAAVGFALAQSAVVTFAIFTALGLGLALPYLLLAFQPAWTRLLPRPGAWMEVLKQATAVPIFATVIWMVWLFAQSAGINALAGLLLAFLLLAVAGWVLGRWPARRASTAWALLLLVLAIAVPVYAVRALGAKVPASAAAASTQWEPWTPELVAKYQAAGHPVFVDFTASWCLSCQVNERVVLRRADVESRLRNSQVALVRADWTGHDEAIAQTLTALGRSGVPTYALYPGSAGAEPKLLPEVLTPNVVFAALDGLAPQKAQAGVVSSPHRQ